MTKQLEPDRETVCDRLDSLPVENFPHVNSAGGHISPVDEDILKAVVRTPDFFDHCCQGGYKRFAMQGWANIAERYMSGDVYLCIGTFWGDAAIQRHIGKHCAFIQVGGIRKDNATLVEGKIIEALECSLRVDGDEFHMLVDVRHKENVAENFVPSVVRLCAENGLSQIAVEVAQVANEFGLGSIESFAGSNETLESVAGRKMDVLGFSGALTQSSERNSSLVERGTQLVDEFTSQDVNNFWRARIYDDFRQFVSGLSFRIENNPARVLGVIILDIPTQNLTG